MLTPLRPSPISDPAPDGSIGVTHSHPRAVIIVIALLLALGLARLLAVAAHAPLYAYANTYDQVRYTACFDLYPDRSAAMPPDQNRPEEPYSRYHFIPDALPICYWSSELLFQGATVAIYHMAEALGLGDSHDVRWIGGLRITALLALVLAFIWVHLRRREYRAAIAHAALFGILFSDPANALYINSFYAEWSALLGAYVLIATLLLWRNFERTAARVVILSLLAFLLAISKIQHLFLPLAIGVVVLVLGVLRSRRVPWQALPVLIGGVIGMGIGFFQMQRDGPLMESIRAYNRADVLFTAVLPFANDKRALLSEVGVDPDCDVYSGKHAWEMPAMPQDVCSGINGFTRGVELKLLLHHPGIMLRLAGAGVVALNPWIAKNIGQVEGGVLAEIPSTIPSIGRLLRAAPMLQWAILALPFAGLLVIGVRCGRSGSVSLDYAAITCALMHVTLTVTVLGDGLADTAKQGHLIVNAALAYLIIVAVMLIVDRAGIDRLQKA